MKQILIIILSSILLLSCQSNKDKNTINTVEPSEAGTAVSNNPDQYECQIENDQRPGQNQIESLAKETDRLIEQKLLIKYSYSHMSGCGGGLYGYYKDSIMLMTDATYKAELGFSSRKIYWHDGNIIKIIYREHFAEWAKYEENYPPDKYEWDPNKMTYTDTVYQITLGKKYQMQKMAVGELISEKSDPNLINRLIDCGLEMRQELETEKILEK